MTSRGYLERVDHHRAQAWLDRYVAAWKSYDAHDIGELFSDDVRYRYYPHADWVVGRDAVVATGTSTYTNCPDGPVDQVFDNCFVMRFDDAGRCRELTEYYLKRD
jgi:hypothetical protein